QHHELAAFSVGCRHRRFGWEDICRRRLACLEGWLLRQRWRCRHTNITTPDEQLSVLVDCELLDSNDLALQILKELVVQLELSLERPIGDALMPLEKCQYLF